MDAALQSTELLRIFIGCDPRQPVSYNVLQFSIARRSSKPVQITPLFLEQLPMSREGLTPFTYTRWLVPYLCRFEGWALFLDADILVIDDIAKLFACADDNYDLLVVKNPERFEWASVILFNCKKCSKLTPDFVQHASDEDLFNYKWQPDVTVGDLPAQWNHLVGYSPQRDDALLVHYTQGNPMFPEVGACEYSAEWFSEQSQMNAFDSWQSIMGSSVHSTWLAGKLVPRLIVSDKINAAKKKLQTSAYDPQPSTRELQEFSADCPSLRYQTRLQKFLRRHIEGDPTQNLGPKAIDRGLNILSVAQFVRELLLENQVSSLLDYGCGKTIQYAPMEIKNAEGGVFSSLAEYFQVTEINCYDPTYPPVDVPPTGKFDAVVCIDVLDRIPAEDQSWVLAAIFNYATKCVLFKVASWQNSQALDTDEAECCTIKSPVEWQNLLAPFRQSLTQLKIRCIVQTSEAGKLIDI